MSRKRKRTKRSRGDFVSSMMPRSRTLYNALRRDWKDFKTLCNARWSKYAKNLVVGDSLEDDMYLGSGYYGVVFKTSNKKLVVKVTSDADEGYFNQIVLEDHFLRTNAGLPYIFDCFHIPEWGAYIILRENVNYGLDALPESSPLIRSIDVLDEFGERAMKIESKVAGLLRSMQSLSDNITKSDFSYAYKEAQGMMRIEIIKAQKKLPHVAETSKYFYAMDVIHYALDKYGIALWDLHENNLGRHKYDMYEFAKDAPPLDTSCILILDVGGNFGSPIMENMIDAVEV